MRIFKYDLGDEPGVKTVEFEQYPDALSVGVQGGRVVLWAAHRGGRQVCTRRFALVMTGEEFDHTIGNGRFLGTVQLEHDDGIAMRPVLHVFAVSGT